MPIDRLSRTTAAPFARWRLGRDLAWVLAIKLAALGLLWTLFFSAEHQPASDAAATGHRLAVGAGTEPLPFNRGDRTSENPSD